MIQKMPFGKTGHESSRLIFGAAAFSGIRRQSAADPILEILLRHGINHIDVAASYGLAELRVGPWMKIHRADFFLATKTGERSRAKAAAEIRRSLKRLQTDHVDLVQFHAVETMEELEKVFRKGGALEAALEARERNLVRFIGITSHGLEAPDVLLAALDRFEFASVLLPCNYPMLRNPAYAAGFRRLAAACAERGVALQTIKSICRRPWPERAKRRTTTWYETLTEPEDVARAVGFVLGRPQLFLNTASDVNLLPVILDAADRYAGPPSDADMEKLAAAREMAPLWA
jgi:aryl-alcohol dehydrogenase-like predicted oxidoreductase